MRGPPVMISSALTILSQYSKIIHKVVYRIPSMNIVQELPGVERLLLGMKPTTFEGKTSIGYQYSTDALLKKIKRIEQNGKFTFKNGMTASTKDLAIFMYKINFITARKEMEDGEIHRKYFEENRYLLNEFVEFGYDWEIIPPTGGRSSQIRSMISSGNLH